MLYITALYTTMYQTWKFLKNLETPDADTRCKEEYKADRKSSELKKDKGPRFK
jgi:hypothetical protein